MKRRAFMRSTAMAAGALAIAPVLGIHLADVKPENRSRVVIQPLDWDKILLQRDGHYLREVFPDRNGVNWVRGLRS